MKKVAKAILLATIIIMSLFTTVYAGEKNSTKDTLETERTGKLLELRTHEATTLEEYKQEYGSDTYGITAYILDRVRIYSIPLLFIGIAFSAIYQYVIGLKRLDVRDKGFNSMIAIITIGVICQILPLVFAIVVTSAEK